MVELSLELKVAWIGKTKEAAIQALSDEYLSRLRRYVEIEGLALRDEAALLAMATPTRRSQAKPMLVLLDGRGKQITSEELAEFVGKHQERNPAPLVFAVGAANGFSEPTRQAASMLLSLGRMTLAHELARVVLLEQLYRAFTILKGHPYHLSH